jgi:hypothetical protein
MAILSSPNGPRPDARCPDCLHHMLLPEPFPTTLSGSPLGWESGRERRRQTPKGVFAGQAGNGHRLGRTVSARCVPAVWGDCAGSVFVRPDPGFRMPCACGGQQGVGGQAPVGQHDHAVVQRAEQPVR